MSKSVFDFRDYRAYIKHRISQLPKGGHGGRASMAAAISCPTSHISQVLSGISHLSLEQAEAVNEYWGHTEDESDFFLLLIQYSRAGTQALAQRLLSQISKKLQSRLVLKDRLKVRSEISATDQATFYSSWLYGAVHVMLSIPKFKTREAIAAHLGISPKYAGEIIEFLVSVGLAIQDGAHYRIGNNRIHLGSDSMLISKFHTNWRMKAIQNMEKETSKEDLHYSSAISISESDYFKIKNRLVECIEEITAVIKDSKEEGAHCFSLDFFRI